MTRTLLILLAGLLLSCAIPSFHSEPTTVEIIEQRDVVLPCLGWTGDAIANGRGVLVQWLGPPEGTDSTPVLLAEMEVPAVGDVSTGARLTKTNMNSRVEMISKDLSLGIAEVRVGDTGLYTCKGSEINNSEEGPQLFEAKVRLQVHVMPSPPEGIPQVKVLGPRTIQVIWKPVETVNMPVTGYLVMVSVPGESSPTQPLKEKFVFGNVNTTNVENLWPYTQYVVKVRTVNGEVESANSRSSLPVETPEAAPEGKPKMNQFVNGTTYIFIDFEAPLKQKWNGLLLGYQMTYKPAGAEGQPESHNITDIDITTYNFTNLDAYTPYMLTVSAYNLAGMGPPLEVVIWTDEGLPGPPIIIHFQNRTNNMLDVKWQRPPQPNGLILGYNIYWNIKDTNTVHNATLDLRGQRADDPWHMNYMYMNYAIHGLGSNTVYVVMVSAYTKKGEGAKSDPHRSFTDVKAPGAPKIVNLTANSSTSILLFVQPPYKLHSQVHRYYIRYTHDGSTYIMEEYHTMGKEEETYVELLLKGLDPGKTYQVQVAAGVKSLFGSRFFIGEYSEPRVLPLSGTPSPPGGTLKPAADKKEKDKMASGIIAGVVCTAVLLILAIVVFTVVRYRRYLKRRYQFISDPDNAQLNASVALPDAYDPEECAKESVPVDDFGEQVLKLHADGDLGFSQEYEEINQNMTHEVTSNSSHDPENRNKNRYLNIVAYDHSRVILRPIAGRPRSDYINANYVDGYHKPRAYIAAQGPLPSTFSDFWRMVWEQRSAVIIMITNLMERGRRKCDQYWPSEGEHQYEQMLVKLLNTYTMAHYTIRVFTIKHLKLRKKSNNERVVVQYHYTDWPDHGVPDFTLPSLAFIRKSALASGSHAGPPVIHCSAGVGRTGTYIVIDSMMRQIEEKNTINIYGFLSHIRTQRNHLVQTEDQYIFIHDAILEHILSGDTEVKASNMSSYLKNLEKTEDGKDSQLVNQYKMVTSFKPRDYHIASGLMPVNVPKNVDPEVIPVELSRVCLPAKPGEEGSDYINASYLHGYSKNREFVVTQRPLSSTTEDFWRMVWDQNSDLIVLLSPSEEAVYANVVSENSPFWPEKDTTMDCGLFKVTFTEETHENGNNHREFILQSTQDDYECTTRMITTSYWPDACTPLSTVFDLIQKVRNMYLEKEEEGPIIVIDKSGGSEACLFCAMYTLYEQLYHEGSVDIYMLAKLYHLKRPGSFPNMEKYKFLYKAVETLCTSDNIPPERDFTMVNGTVPYASTLPTEANGRAASKILSRNETTM